LRTILPQAGRQEEKEKGPVGVNGRPVSVIKLDKSSQLLSPDAKVRKGKKGAQMGERGKGKCLSLQSLVRTARGEQTFVFRLTKKRSSPARRPAPSTEDQGK